MSEGGCGHAPARVVERIKVASPPSPAAVEITFDPRPLAARPPRSDATLDDQAPASADGVRQTVELPDEAVDGAW